MPLTKPQFANLLPHRDPMCLIDTVENWNEQVIECTVENHTRSDNPLRYMGQLHSIVGIEYAAQAMAIHAGLLNKNASQPKMGLLASARNVEMFTDRLDNITEPLLIKAEKLLNDEDRVLYEFKISVQQKCLLSGRIAVVLKGEIK